MSPIEEYKRAFTALILDRELRGPLPAEEETRRAGEHVVLWNQLSENEQAELEVWLETQLNPP